ncbi:MAG: hypothetical protein ACI4SS_02600 [Clostridia bacterium]
MFKQIILTAAALGLCYLAGVPIAGLCFAAAAFFVSFPRLAKCQWYEIVIGALLCNIAAMLAGDNTFVFWGLLLTAALAVSLCSLWKTFLLCAAAWVMLSMDTSPEIYISLFAGIAWNAILVFTYEKICGKIESSRN